MRQRVTHTYIDTDVYKRSEERSTMEIFTLFRLFGCEETKYTHRLSSKLLSSARGKYDVRIFRLECKLYGSNRLIRTQPIAG